MRTGPRDPAPRREPEHPVAPAGAVRAAGVTLVELVLGLVIVGLLAGVAAPRFFERRGFEERLFADEVAAALRHAQKVALASGCAVEVAIDGAGYALHQQAACAGALFDRDVPHPARGDAYAGAPPAGVALASSVVPFRFDAQGRALDAAGVPADVDVTVGTRHVGVSGQTGLVDGP